jgi:hypothetical protein
VLVLLVVEWACTASPRTSDALAARFNEAIEGAQAQQGQVQQVIGEAVELQNAILSQGEFRFEEKTTVAFIEKWAEANLAVERLRASLADMNQNYLPMLEQLRTRAQAISDPYIRGQTLGYLDDTQQAYDRQAQEAQKCLQDLDASILLGNDIVEALKIIGSANFIRVKLEELGQVCRQSVAGLQQVNRLVNQGRDLLGLEIKAGSST